MNQNISFDSVVEVKTLFTAITTLVHQMFLPTFYNLKLQLQYATNSVLINSWNFLNIDHTHGFDINTQDFSHSFLSPKKPTARTFLIYKSLNFIRFNFKERNKVYILLTTFHRSLTTWPGCKRSSLVMVILLFWSVDSSPTPTWYPRSSIDESSNFLKHNTRITICPASQAHPQALINVNNDK